MHTNQPHTSEYNVHSHALVYRYNEGVFGQSWNVYIRTFLSNLNRYTNVW